MWRATIKGKPKSVNYPYWNPKAKRMFLRSDYVAYKKWLISEFDQYANDPELRKMFDTQKFGLGVKVTYWLPAVNGSTLPTYRSRPDINNLYRATIDALFASKVNMFDTGEARYDKDGNRMLDYKTHEPLNVMKQRLDDSNITYTAVLKLAAQSAEEVGQMIVIGRVGMDKL